LSSALCVELLRTVRGSLSCQDSLDKNHALLAQRVLRPWHPAVVLQHGFEALGLGREASVFVPPHGIHGRRCYADDRRQKRPHTLAAVPRGLVHGTRPGQARRRKLPIAMAAPAMTG